MASNQLREQLLDLTVEELRQVSLTIPDFSTHIPGRKAELVEHLLEKGGAHVGVTASRVEALRPFKHCWLFSLGGLPIRAPKTEALKDWASQLWPNLEKTEAVLDPSSGELQPTIQLHDPWKQCLYVKLTHWVQSNTWEDIDASHRVLVKRRVRHPVVAVLNGRLGTLEVRFDGFTQGLGTPKAERVSYESIAYRAATLVAQRLGTEAVGIPLNDAVTALVESMPDQVQDVRREIRPASGGRLLLDAGERTWDISVAEYLISFFDAAGKRLPKQLQEGVRHALRNIPANSVLLAWKNPGILTRIANYAAAPEIYFIWRGGDKSLESIEYIIGELVSHYRFVTPTDLAGVLDYIRKLPGGSTVQATDLIQQFHLSAADAYHVLEEARKLSLVARQFRVRSDLRFEDFQNSWQSSLSKLPRTVTDENGRSIDLQQPENIEVGFIRSREVR